MQTDCKLDDTNGRGQTEMRWFKATGSPGGVYLSEASKGDDLIELRWVVGRIHRLVISSEDQDEYLFTDVDGRSEAMAVMRDWLDQ